MQIGNIIDHPEPYYTCTCNHTGGMKLDKAYVGALEGFNSVEF